VFFSIKVNQESTEVREKLSRSRTDVPGQFLSSCGSAFLSLGSADRNVLEGCMKICLFQHAGKIMSFIREEKDVIFMRTEQPALWG